MEELISPQGSREIDVAAEFQNLAGDVIARTAFGRIYEEGKMIFELQKSKLNWCLKPIITFTSQVSGTMFNHLKF